jgi:hypothetical protein
MLAPVVVAYATDLIVLMFALEVSDAVKFAGAPTNTFAADDATDAVEVGLIAVPQVADS